MNNYRDTLYSNYFSHQIRATVADEAWTHRVFSKEILPHLAGFEQKFIGELGCGHGNLLRFLKKNGFQNLMGCDLSEEQVEIARKEGLQVALQDAQSFVESKESWDAFLAIDVLEHLTKNEAVELLKQIHSRIPASGKLVIRVPNADAAIGGSYLWSDVTHELFLNAASARQLFQSCGFQDVLVLGSFSEARGWKRFLSTPLRAMIQLKLKLTHLAFGVGSSGKIWTPNLIIVARKGK